MTNEEMKYHNEQMDILTNIIKEQNIKCIYCYDKNSTQFIYFDDIKE